MVRANILVFLLAGVKAVVGAKPVSKIVPGAYIVELEDAQVSHSNSAFFSKIESKCNTRMKFNSSLFKGASIQFNDLQSAEANAKGLLSLYGVKQVWPMKTYSLPKDEILHAGNSGSFIENVKRQVGNDTFSPHLMTQVDKLRAEGFVGNGVKIGIVDTGVDYTHPALGGCFGEGCLVSYGYDLVGDNYTGSNTPVPDTDPYDGCEGHGTHVAGIIAAQANPFGFTGAAPGVTLGAYRVFGCDGNAGSDILIDSYLRAFEDGSNIITASIGDSSGWSEDPWAVVASRIVEQGVPCTISAGNSGSAGLFYTSTAANGKKVTAIASTDNVISPMLLVSSYYTVDGGDNLTFGYVLGTPGDWAGVNLPLWTPTFNVTDPAGGCDPYPSDTPDLSGFIVLVRRGTCTFVQKAENAAAFGAKYVVYYNNVDGALSPAAAVEGILAVGMVTSSQGEKWVALLEAGSEVSFDMLDPDTAPVVLGEGINNVTGGFASTFSSWGPTFEADIKPQLASPGGHILSTYPVTLGSYAVLSGTSMACPLAAAIFALISNVRGTLDPNELQHVLATTSNPNLHNDGTTTYPVLAPVAQVGSGLMQAYDAAYATTLLSVSSLAYNDTDNLVDTLNFTITNTGTEEVTYNLSYVSAATGYTFSNDIYPDLLTAIEFDESFATIELSESKVAVPPGAEATIEVTVKPPEIDASRLPVYSGYITLNATNGENLSLPYQGIVGSLHDTTVLDGAYLSSTSDPAAEPITSENITFILPRYSSTEAALPLAVISLCFGSPLVKIEVLSVPGYGNSTNTAKSLGNILGSPLPYLPRDSFTIDWNGKLEDGSFAAAGKYLFKVAALHIFGDANNTDEYDVAQTAAFTIEYV
ncbi:serine-type endopeptidase-like protein [Pseudomassariella vexata]|uniref:Serine-type endopeptidase-like protein n=1 Tax=Pseudomassariella vexata TaxID=1141098 RepID=A0A1Y2DJA9_9PEZI|nr:serine-type endopeptidase-like protein [Pseudomassariella vexata]ORY59256.1 serine-type endopeptidase-like protein [Pseudomassariella vexata]